MAESAASSLVAARSIAPALSSTGASLRARTVIEAVSLAVLKGVEPPLRLVSAVAPAVPVIWSHARKVMPSVTVPYQFQPGTKRIQVAESAISSLAALSVREPKVFQVDSAPILYCQKRECCRLRYGDPFAQASVRVGDPITAGTGE